MMAVAPFAHADTSIINVYDANGNLVTGDGRYYEYNDANQLVRVRQGDTIAGPVIAEYFYDFSDQRVKKIENGVVTYYVGKHFEKQVGGTNAGSTSYYFGDDGERVAKKDPAGNIYYYHLDHLDGINAVTDSAGTIVARTDYLPFGDTRAGGSGSEKYSYTGKEKDKTDLYYFEARYNSPEFRHFTQADIAEPDYSDPQDLNRYSYVGNNPLSYVDYDGYKKKKKKHLSKREQRARSLGLNPDKDKYKVGKWSNEKYKKIVNLCKKSNCIRENDRKALDTALNLSKLGDVYSTLKVLYKGHAMVKSGKPDKGAISDMVENIPAIGSMYKMQKTSWMIATDEASHYLSNGKKGKHYSFKERFNLTLDSTPVVSDFKSALDYFGERMVEAEDELIWNIENFKHH